jgi:Ser/Thr protein kinase RdoA (MazF antagonist)
MSDNVGRLLATGNVAEVFEFGSRVVKLYRLAEAKQVVLREAANHAAVEELGLPVPRLQSVLQIAGRWGIVFDRVDQPSFAEKMRRNPGLVAHYLETLAQLQARIHGYPAHRLANLKLRLATNIERARLLEEPRRHVLLSRLADMPNGDRLCHGDFHPINVLGQASDPIVIDWPDATCGDPAADACRSYLLLKLHAEEIADPYLDAYCRSAAVPRVRILDWLPYVAAARLAENVPDDLDRLRKIADAAP